MNKKITGKNLLWLEVISIIIGSCSERTSKIWLDDLKIKSFSEGVPAILPKKCASGDSILPGGKYFERGVGVLSLSVLSFLPEDNARKFCATIRADGKANREIPESFYVIGDRKILCQSGPMQVGEMGSR